MTLIYYPENESNLSGHHIHYLTLIYYPENESNLSGAYKSMSSIVVKR